MTTRKTIGFTGMDSADGEKLKSLFAEANRRSGEAWTLASDNDSDMLVIDVDTLYGHMTWLKVHNSGRIIVALSGSAKADADHVLLRPVTVENFAQLLAQQAGSGAAATAPPRPATATPAPANRPTAEPTTRAEPVAAPASPPASPPPAAKAAPAAPTAAPASSGSPAASAPPVAASATPAPAAAAAPAAPAAPEPPPPHDPMLGDYLQPGALPGPVKLKLADAGWLVLDPQSRTYLGPTALKGFLPYAKAVIQPEEWTAVTSAEVERLKGELGGPQPYVRLQWLAALHANDGQIARGYDPNQKYRLSKWPQIEREFPKHFRIATAMMKGPQLLTEIAEASGATLAEVTDFVNASLATGFAEMDAPPPSPDAAGTGAKGGLLNRLRGTR